MAAVGRRDAPASTARTKRCTKVVGAFPDGQSALNLAAARLHHIAGTRWSTRRYLDMTPLHHEDLQTA